MRRTDTPSSGGKPYDVSTRDLVALNPSDWLVFAGLLRSARGATVTQVDADTPVVAIEADQVLLVERPPKAAYLAHIEFQTNYDARMDRRMLRPNALLYEQKETPVHSALVLLRPEADGPNVKGRVRVGGMRFRY